MKRRHHAVGMEERIAAQRVDATGSFPLEESVAIEEPLSITLNGEPWITTMRTPGHDSDLILGLLFTEGIIQSPDQIHEMVVDNDNTTIIGKFSLDPPQHGFIRSSSCGICGIESLPSSEVEAISSDGFSIPASGIDDLLSSLRSAQDVFDSTGGVHAVALFTPDGVITDIAEDVGRHNAMDKVIGRSLNDLPLANHGFLLSGRVSYEMVQKAVMAGAPCIVAIGAPTTLAVDLARQHGITLIGFARDKRFNVYAGAHRLKEA